MFNQKTIENVLLEIQSVRAKFETIVLTVRLELRCQKVEGERERWRAKCLELEETNRQLQVET